VRPASDDRALQVIIAYKLVKGSLQLLAAAVLLVLVVRHIAANELHEAVTFIREHFTSATSVRIASLLSSLEEGHRLALTGTALAIDGVVTTSEGVALQRRWWWGPWLVVVVTGLFLPFELYELVRQPRVGRVVLVIVNAALVAYLARRVMKEHRAHEARKSAGAG
jgi:uncharacterized membrane protein (DUF2068 family)